MLVHFHIASSSARPIDSVCIARFVTGSTTAKTPTRSEHAGQGRQSPSAHQQFSDIALPPSAGKTFVLDSRQHLLRTEDSEFRIKRNSNRIPRIQSPESASMFPGEGTGPGERDGGWCRSSSSLGSLPATCLCCRIVIVSSACTCSVQPSVNPNYPLMTFPEPVKFPGTLILRIRSHDGAIH